MRSVCIAVQVGPGLLVQILQMSTVVVLARQEFKDSDCLVSEEINSSDNKKEKSHGIPAEMMGYQTL